MDETVKKLMDNVKKFHDQHHYAYNPFAMCLVEPCYGSLQLVPEYIDGPMPDWIPARIMTEPVVLVQGGKKHTVPPPPRIPRDSHQA